MATKLYVSTSKYLNGPTTAIGTWTNSPVGGDVEQQVSAGFTTYGLTTIAPTAQTIATLSLGSINFGGGVLPSWAYEFAPVFTAFAPLDGSASSIDGSTFVYTVDGLQENPYSFQGNATWSNPGQSGVSLWINRIYIYRPGVGTLGVLRQADFNAAYWANIGASDKGFDYRWWNYLGGNIYQSGTTVNGIQRGDMLCFEFWMQFALYYGGANGYNGGASLAIKHSGTNAAFGTSKSRGINNFFLAVNFPAGGILDPMKEDQSPITTLDGTNYYTPLKVATGS